VGKNFGIGTREFGDKYQPMTFSDIMMMRSIHNFFKYTSESEIDKLNEKLKEINEKIQIAKDPYRAIYPTKNDVGDPFWALMEIKEGLNTGNLYNQVVDGKSSVTLFTNKEGAELYRELIFTNYTNKDIWNYEVVGLTKQYIDAIPDEVDDMNCSVVLFLGMDNKKVATLQISIEETKQITNGELSIYDCIKQNKKKSSMNPFNRIIRKFFIRNQ
jgi:hypothetical protein